MFDPIDPLFVSIGQLLNFLSDECLPVNLERYIYKCVNFIGDQNVWSYRPIFPKYWSAINSFVWWMFTSKLDKIYS